MFKNTFLHLNLFFTLGQKITNVQVDAHFIILEGIVG